MYIWPNLEIAEQEKIISYTDIHWSYVLLIRRTVQLTAWCIVLFINVNNTIQSRWHGTRFYPKLLIISKQRDRAGMTIISPCPLIHSEHYWVQPFSVIRYSIKTMVEVGVIACICSFILNKVSDPVLLFLACLGKPDQLISWIPSICSLTKNITLSDSWTTIKIITKRTQWVAIRPVNVGWKGADLWNNCNTNDISGKHFDIPPNQYIQNRPKINNQKNNFRVGVARITTYPK